MVLVFCGFFLTIKQMIETQNHFGLFKAMA